jgi:phosphonate transport system permease protein
MGHGWLERSFGVILPESANNLISQAVFMFEYNFRHGTVIGIVGAGGIGYYINLYLKFLQYEKVFAYVIVIFIVVLVLDILSKYARSLFNDDKVRKKHPWWTILLPSSVTQKLEEE